MLISAEWHETIAYIRGVFIPTLLSKLCYLVSQAGVAHNQDTPRLAISTTWSKACWIKHSIESGVINRRICKRTTRRHRAHCIGDTHYFTRHAGACYSD